MKPANLTETIKRETFTVKYGANAGKKGKNYYDMGFARERDSKGKIHNRGILYRTTKFPSGKESFTLLTTKIIGRTKADTIRKAKALIKKNKW